MIFFVDDFIELEKIKEIGSELKGTFLGGKSDW
jgi:hypothetical protein